VREGTASSVMAADRPYGKFYDFYNVSPEYILVHVGFHTNYKKTICPILKKTVKCWQIVVIIKNVKFHDKPFCGNCVVLCQQTRRRTDGKATVCNEAKNRSPQLLCNRAWKKICRRVRCNGMR
jgi:hypothetical protein